MKITGVCCAFFLLGINLCVGQSNTQVENATAFAHLYGYVRFFHPSDEAAGLDWNRFAIYGAKQVEGCRNPQELAATLRALFQPIAPTAQIYTGNKPVASLIRKTLTLVILTGTDYENIYLAGYPARQHFKSCGGTA